MDEEVDFESLIVENPDKTVREALTEYFDEATSNEIVGELEDMDDKKVSELDEQQRTDLLDMVEAYE